MASSPHTEKRRDLYQEVTDRIVAALEAGTPPWVRPWSTAGEPGPQRNGASGHVYKGINTVLTGMSGFASPRWYTFNQAKALGGSVRKGEKGSTVIYWQFVDAKGTDTSSDDADEAVGRSKKIPLLRHYVVFNAEQIEWPEGSKHAVVDGALDHVADDDNYDGAVALVTASGADIQHQGVRAYYQPGADRIVVPAPSRFDDAASYHATVLHELAHWTGHKSRLNRDLTGRFGSESYAAEELVAELAAAFLCVDLGIDGKLQHAEYIGSWVKVLQSDKRAIFTASRLAQEAADYLLARAGRGTATALKEAA